MPCSKKRRKLPITPEGPIRIKGLGSVVFVTYLPVLEPDKMGVTLVEEDIPMDAFKAMLTSDANRDKTVVVDFFAVWCGPCVMISPELEKLEEENSGKVAVIKINVDECPTVSTALEIRAMPTFFFYKNGEKMDELVGASVDDLKQKALA